MSFHAACRIFGRRLFDMGIRVTDTMQSGSDYEKMKARAAMLAENSEVLTKFPAFLLPFR